MGFPPVTIHALREGVYSNEQTWEPPPDPLRSYFQDEKQAGIDYNGIRQRTLKKKRFDREYSQAAYLFQIESYKQ